MENRLGCRRLHHRISSSSDSKIAKTAPFSTPKSISSLETTKNTSVYYRSRKPET
ncbi:hypothetical protein COLO4_16583 [Corchorus olitorius]|uniref:Uncharacterized protein n=1 Tax=Corchorus olitorius TaxID=93759 RepID=A0A1R3JGL2_9ROSI|nr:hypothetical protein COLO4_16583 [Corchorus olitorius]